MHMQKREKIRDVWRKVINEHAVFRKNIGDSEECFEEKLKLLYETLGFCMRECLKEISRLLNFLQRKTIFNIRASAVCIRERV